jgi:colicin import membrane protein
MLDKIIAFIDSLLINALLITIFVLSTEWVFKPNVVQPAEEVIQVVALDEGQVQDAIKLIKQQEKRQLEAQQAKQRELEKIAYEQKLKVEPIEPPKPDKQRRIKERKALEQKQLDEANRKAEEKAEKERQRLEVAKRKAKQLDEERLAKESEKKPRKQVEDKQKERERLAKQEKAEEKKRQTREEQKRKTAEKRKAQEQSANQEEKREADKQRKAEAKRKAAAAAAEKQKVAAAAAEEKRKKEAAEAGQQKRAQDNRARIGQVRAQIASRVKSRWRQPAGTNLSCVVFVSILPSGALIPRLSKSSGNGAFDQSAIAAVRSASPFPIPKELLGFFRGEGVSVTFRSH